MFLGEKQATIKMSDHGDTVSQRDVVLVFYFNRLQPLLIKKYKIDFFTCFALPIKEIRDRRQTAANKSAFSQKMTPYDSFNQHGVFNLYMWLLQRACGSEGRLKPA